jgi:hypothetical protein
MISILDTITLCVNRLFYYENDEDPESCIGYIFTESCTFETPPVSPPKDDEFQEKVPFVITTVGNRKYVLFAMSEAERSNWIEAIEISKVLSHARCDCHQDSIYFIYVIMNAYNF